MFSSTNEINGFSAVGQEELEVVNGGDPAAFWAGFVAGGVVGLAVVTIVVLGTIAVNSVINKKA
jgi:hypothetical protein